MVLKCIKYDPNSKIVVCEPCVGVVCIDGQGIAREIVFEDPVTKFWWESQKRRGLLIPQGAFPNISREARVIRDCMRKLT